VRRGLDLGNLTGCGVGAPLRGTTHHLRQRRPGRSMPRAGQRSVPSSTGSRGGVAFGELGGDAGSGGGQLGGFAGLVDGGRALIELLARSGASGASDRGVMLAGARRLRCLREGLG
jgi:hypothetical protein